MQRSDFMTSPRNNMSRKKISTSRLRTLRLPFNVSVSRSHVFWQPFSARGKSHSDLFPTTPFDAAPADTRFQNCCSRTNQQFYFAILLDIYFRGLDGDFILDLASERFALELLIWSVLML